jgi:hypothetical protein
VKRYTISIVEPPRVYIQPPIGTLVRVPDGGAEPVIGRVIRYEGAMCVVAKQDHPSVYEVWAFVEPSDVVKEH